MQFELIRINYIKQFKLRFNIINSSHHKGDFESLSINNLDILQNLSMDISPFLYDNLPQPQENNYLIQEERHQYLSKLNFNKTLFRMQSPEPSIQDDCFQNENDKSFVVDFADFNFVNHQRKLSSDDEEEIQSSKKNQKAKKLRKKSKNRDGPLSEKEFTEIMKKLDQCHQIMKMIDNMSKIVNTFRLQLQKQSSLNLK